MNKKLLLEIISAIAVILIAIGGYYYWQKYYKIAPASTAEAPQTFGEQISEQAITNPAEKIPQTNPYEAKTNPFEKIKTNPFQDGYKNPFGQ
ncbi:MAG: hypothetical protein AAB396_00890 [Patescibacteria group bacterium]